MGQAAARVAQQTEEVVMAEPPPTEVVSLFRMWPGLEEQLELSFASLDIDSCGLVYYEALEPMLRHHLMQMGLLEMVARLVNNETGALDLNHIDHYLKEYGVKIDEELDLNDWKLLCAAWIRRIMDLHEETEQKWRDEMALLQIQQSQKYQEALHRFQENYLSQLSNYYNSIDAAHKKEEEYRHEWENSLNLQQEFFETQMQFLQSRNEEALALYKSQVLAEGRVADQVLKHLDIGRIQPDNDICPVTTVKFAYPASITVTGAPISGGAPCPFKRRRQRK